MEYLAPSLQGERPTQSFNFAGSRGYPLVVITNVDEWIAAIDVLQIKETGCS